MFTERRSGLRPHKQTPAQGWPDIVGPLLLALCGGFGLEAFTPHSVNNLALAYLTHAWYLAIVGFWVWILGRRFPLGRLSRQGLSGWFRPWILVGTLYLVLVLLSPGPPAHHAIVSLLIFQGVVVGPTEELLFRGLIQTAMNHSIMASPVWGSLRLGTNNWDGSRIRSRSCRQSMVSATEPHDRTSKLCFCHRPDLRSLL